ncbi:hypothetical protein VOLCADRAFT_104500 [Volvox carteri f. nagariensis]|uniref:Pherophorin domain-containing protein n=1 Tax=Volvox carteri f. nagariensis TaxID=3068 RepID=D8TU08_VOLCA|nr:uncharacterized protein VOLCADRAFT_104500 [Volvox carteri f. nagariensis]EFJ48955.1 hypothetical protein VOLCADRAFT_104500 [Volvox carteri f. nagariensis]|eukprot:XP_002949852.1 hypothetical protein VOLCADRAFT_104500 [Volvox carteri f. nagariensis]
MAGDDTLPFRKASAMGTVLITIAAAVLLSVARTADAGPPIPDAVRANPPPSLIPKRSPPPPSSCLFCAIVYVAYPAKAGIDPNACTDCQDRIISGVRYVYSDSNVAVVNSTCSNGGRRTTVCMSVQSSALPAVPQPRVDAMVLNWAGMLHYSLQPFCVPMSTMVAEIKSRNSCLASKQSTTLYCDRFNPPPAPRNIRNPPLRG